jgi:hypothetical protein
MFCVPRHVFGAAEGVGSCFHVFRARTRFRRYRRRRVPFSCFALPSKFSAVRRASGPVFMFCALVLIFDGTEGVESRFRVLRSRTHFRRYRGRRVLFSCFEHPDSFSAETRALAPVFMFCIPGHVFGGTEGVGSHFNILRARLIFGGTEAARSGFLFLHSRTYFRQFRGRLVLFSCSGRPHSFSAVPRASGPIFMFYAPELIFDGNEGVGSCFHVLRARTRFRWYRGRRVPFSCFARPASFSAIPRASGLISMFCVPR